MKHLKEIISEKLKINKDSKINKLSYTKSLLSLSEKDDKVYILTIDDNDPLDMHIYNDCIFHKYPNSIYYEYCYKGNKPNIVLIDYSENNNNKPIDKNTIIAGTYNILRKDFVFISYSLDIIKIILNKIPKDYDKFKEWSKNNKDDIELKKFITSNI